MARRTCRCARGRHRRGLGGALRSLLLLLLQFFFYRACGVRQRERKRYTENAERRI